MKDKEIAKEFYSMMEQYAIIETVGVFITNKQGTLEISPAFETEVMDSIEFVGGFCNEQNTVPIMIDFMNGIRDAINCHDISPDIDHDGFYVLRFFLKKNDGSFVIANTDVVEYLTFKEFAERVDDDVRILKEILDEDIE